MISVETTMTTMRLYQTIKKQERMEAESIPYVTIRYCYYNDPEMYTEIVALSEFDLDDTTKRHTSDKSCVIERADGQTVRLIDGGFFNVTLHNLKDDFQDWLVGNLGVFPTNSEDYQLSARCNI